MAAAWTCVHMRTATGKCRHGAQSSCESGRVADSRVQSRYAKEGEGDGEGDGEGEGEGQGVREGEYAMCVKRFQVSSLSNNSFQSLHTRMNLPY
jgi:hypothetical protein